MKTPIEPSEIRARLMNQVEIDSNGCWLWLGSLTYQGYGQVTVDYKNWRTHRLSYQLDKGLIPQGLVLDHLCRVRRCINPEHLQPVTNRINVLRGVGPSAVAAKRDACSKGHRYTDESTRMERGRRMCRTCDREKMRRLRKKWHLAAVDKANGATS